MERNYVSVIPAGIKFMPAGFRRHLMGKTLRNVCHCDIT